MLLIAVADYSAKIKLIVEGLQSLKQVEERVKNLNRLAAVDIGKAITGSKSFSTVKKEVDGVADSFARLGKVVRGIAVGTGLGALTTTVNSLSQAATALKFGGIAKFAAALAATTGPAAALFKELSNLAIQFPVVAGTATVAGAALIAFAPQVIRAGNATTKLAKAAAEAGQPLTRLLANLAGSGFRVDLFIDAAEAAEVYKNRLFELSETVANLSRRQTALQSTLNRFNSDSETAAKIATKLVDITRRLNAEQQAQNDLLRQAAGLRPQSVENKATNTFNVIQRRKKFLAEQAQATAEAARQTRALEQAESDAARTRLAQAAKEKAAQLQSQAAAADKALTAIRNLEAAESNAARARLAAAAEQRRKLAGTAQAYAFPVGPNQASGRRIAAFGEVSADVAERALIEREKRKLFEQEKAQLAEIDRLRATNIRKEEQRFKNLGKTIGGSLSSAAIGGVFPLLFGQSPQAAVGGAIGGLLGGAGGGFAGSLIGTAIGDLAAAKSAVEELGRELGFSEAQTEALSEAFRQAGRDSDKLNDAIVNIQGIGLSTTETASAVKLVSELTTEYGGKVDKVAQALANALEGGKVGISTLNAFTAQGIPIQEELAKKYGVSRDKLLELAKDGKVSVQDLVDTLVEIGRAAESTVNKSQSAFDKFKLSVENLSTAVANFATNILRTLAPVLDTILTKVTGIINAFNVLLQGNVGRQLAQAGLSFTFGATSQGLDNIRGVLTAISSINPQSVKEVNSLLNNLDDASRNLQRIGPSDPNAQKAVELQGKILQQRNRLLEAQKSLQGAGGAAGITPITAPSQLPTTAGGRGAKGPEDRTADLLDDLEALKLISITRDGIRDALFEGNKELAIQLDYDQKIYDIQRDTSKALRDANFETERAVIRAQEIVRIKDAQLERDDELRQLARDIQNIITDTLDDLRGGVTWDDTGLRDIFDLRLPDAINEFQENIAALQDPTNQIIGAATAIGDAFASSFRDVVSGAASAQQGLANFFKNVGDYFIDLSARILAEALKLQAVQIISSIFSSALGSFGTSSLTLPGLEGAGALSSGSLFPGGAFAEGGFVTGPTRALIGEGGAEYVIPASKMPGAMARYAAGLRGGSVIDGAVFDNRNFLDSLTTAINNPALLLSQSSEDDVSEKEAAATQLQRIKENNSSIRSITERATLEQRLESDQQRIIENRNALASKELNTQSTYTNTNLSSDQIFERERFLENRSELATQQSSISSTAERERIFENRMQLDSQRSALDRRYESERLRENRMEIMNQQSETERRFERERIEKMAAMPQKLDISYQSQVINSVEYVTRDEAERLAAQSAIRGRELALGSLQNSVKTRKRVGMA